MAGEFSFDNLSKIQDAIKEDYPTSQALFTGEFQFQHVQTQEGVEPAFESSHRNQKTGFQFSSPDGLMIFQARLDGISFTRMPPYDCWETFRDEAIKLWRIYRDICNPAYITRAAIRFINRFDIPKRPIDIAEYFQLHPEIPLGMPQLVSGFFMQLQMPQQDLNCMAIVNQSMVQPLDPEFSSIILDFDLFREAEWSTEDDEVWGFVEQLRVKKNQLFESSITGMARELII